MDIRFLLLDFAKLWKQWWFSIGDLEIGDFNGCLLHIEYDICTWKFDFLYLHSLWRKYVSYLESKQ